MKTKKTRYLRRFGFRDAQCLPKISVDGVIGFTFTFRRFDPGADDRFLFLSE